MPGDAISFQIDSPRLYIRPWAAEDRPTFARFVNDPDMVRHLGSGEVWDDARIEAFMERQRGTLAKHGCCLGAVVLKASGEGEVVGLAGIQPLGDAGMFEMGWWIWKDHWNRGYATELALAMKQHAFEVMQLPQIVAIANVPNRASIRVMQKAGMRFMGTRNAKELAPRYPDIKVVYYTLDNPATRTRRH